MSGHGHVRPNADGSKARCGGPAICGVCAFELAQTNPLQRIAELEAEVAALRDQGAAMDRAFEASGLSWRDVRPHPLGPGKDGER